MLKELLSHNRDNLLENILFCSSCFNKQQKIDRLEREIASLKAKLRYRDTKNREEYFGSSTPSSKEMFKKKASEENKKKQGGAKKGHTGNGRKIFTDEQADTVIEYFVETTHCPDCNVLLENKGNEERSVIEGEMLKPKKILFRCNVKRCPKCRKTFTRKPPVLKRNKYGTKFISNSAIMHYLHGIPLKRIEDLWGNDIVVGTIIKTFHRIAKVFAPVMEQLKEAYRQAEVKHADETGWRTNGENGYGWLFLSTYTSIFAFEHTRSASVVIDHLGKKELPGVLVVDRYAGYNKVPCNIQYCYAHLLRDVCDLEKEFPEEMEVKRFVSCVSSLLSKAMNLRNKKISDKKYYEQARYVKEKIMEAMNSPGKHPGIQKIQDIFREKTDRLFHWVKKRSVPPDNNYAERELRPTVIARKVSHGSQSKQGAKTRSIMMSVLHTVKKRLKNGSVEDWLNQTLQAYIHNPNIDPYSLLPELPYK